MKLRSNSMNLPRRKSIDENNPLRKSFVSNNNKSQLFQHCLGNPIDYFPDTVSSQQEIMNFLHFDGGESVHTDANKGFSKQINPAQIIELATEYAESVIVGVNPETGDITVLIMLPMRKTTKSFVPTDSTNIPKPTLSSDSKCKISDKFLQSSAYFNPNIKHHFPENYLKVDLSAPEGSRNLIEVFSDSENIVVYSPTKGKDKNPQSEKYKNITNEKVKKESVKQLKIQKFYNKHGPKDAKKKILESEKYEDFKEQVEIVKGDDVFTKFIKLGDDIDKTKLHTFIKGCTTEQLKGAKTAIEDLRNKNIKIDDGITLLEIMKCFESLKEIKKAPWIKFDIDYGHSVTSLNEIFKQIKTLEDAGIKFPCVDIPAKNFLEHYINILNNFLKTNFKAGTTLTFKQPSEMQNLATDINNFKIFINTQNLQVKDQDGMNGYILTMKKFQSNRTIQKVFNDLTEFKVFHKKMKELEDVIENPQFNSLNEFNTCYANMKELEKSGVNIKNPKVADVADLNNYTKMWEALMRIGIKEKDPDLKTLKILTECSAVIKDLNSKVKNLEDDISNISSVAALRTEYNKAMKYNHSQP